MSRIVLPKKNLRLHKIFSSATVSFIDVNN